MSLTRGQRPDIARVHTQVPVTALAFHGQHLLAAQDTSLCIYDIESGSLVAQRSPHAFASVNSGQPIHGINVHPVTGAILLWGASAVAYLPEGWKGKAEISGKATDWIYAGALSPHEAGDQSWQGLGVVVTAHNDLVPLIMDEASGRLVFGHAISPSRPILYSATLSFLTPNTLLVVGGTVFGEIIVWRCRLDSDADSSSGSELQAKVLYTLVGHEGSIFGVAISQPLDNGRRILASCSDDRTIRLWDITDHDLDTTASRNEPGAARETGFNTTSTTSSKPIATAMGHSSRIWGVRLVAAEDDPSSIVVYSFGEDATMQRWGVDLQAGTLSHENTFALNDGKHLWAHALLTRPNGSLLFATGGADSRISLIEEPAPTKTSGSSSLVTIDIKDILKDAPSIANAPKRAKEIITRYDFLSADELVAMTSSGRILRGTVGATATEWRIFPVENEQHAEDLSLCYALKAITPGVVALGTTSGNVYAYDMNKGLSLVTSLDGRIMDILLVEGSLDSTASTVDVYVQLQGNKAPCYLTVNTSNSTLLCKADLNELDDRFVAVSVLKARDYVFIGSRHGYLSILKPHNLEDGYTTYPVIYTLPPRAQDAISCIVEIPSDHTSSSAPPLYIMTTSRDGYYRIYHLHDSPSSAKVSLELLHETPAPFGPILTGAYFKTPDAPSVSPELILHGFGGKDFLIYNETQRAELASIHCGGAHRMHCLWTDPSSANDPARLRFAFTRTSLISIYAQDTVSHRSLTPGTHGREIRALSSNEKYLATGSEDTTIRIWSIEEVDNKPHHLMTMKAHNTGIQQLRWLGPSHLLSSGGFEEFFIWRVRRLKDSLYNGVAVMREAKLEDTSGDTDGDLRIMDFDACWGTERAEEGEQKMIITMVLSDSTLKTYSYTPSGGFVLLGKGRYTGACMTQIRHLTPGTVEEIQLVTGSTDGHLCIWKSDATATYHISSSKKLHQNTIKAMDTLKYKDSSSGHSKNFLVLTGGDDNAIHLSHVTSSASSEDPKTTAYSIIKQASFPRAHAASINGITILPPSESAGASSGYTGVSTSNDQRVKLWDLGSGQKLSLVKDRYSGVADPGDLEVLHGERRTLITGGVGMEVWQVNGQNHEQ